MDLRCHDSRLLALHDATFSVNDAPLLPQRNVLRTVDLHSQVHSCSHIMRSKYVMDSTGALALHPL